MKKYFAKYLPVKGEIKYGDYFVDNWAADKSIRICAKVGEIKGFNTTVITDVRNLYSLPEKCQKVKLFLCSRDIQVDDIVQDGDNQLCKVANEADLKNAEEYGFFKVVGEVSAEAKWVKEEDEFDEGQIHERLFVVFNHNGDANAKVIGAEVERSDFDIIREWMLHQYFSHFVVRVLGPCGHFH